MIADGYELSAEQMAAGRRAMAGRFKTSDVHAALVGAGVPEKLGIDSISTLGATPAMRAADRMVQGARKRMLIRLVSRGVWEVKS